MELTSGQGREGNEQTINETPRVGIGRKAVGSRVEMSGRRPDGSIYKYRLPTQPLGVIFTVEGPIELARDDENH